MVFKPSRRGMAMTGIGAILLHSASIGSPARAIRQAAPAEKGMLAPLRRHYVKKLQTKAAGPSRRLG